MPGKTSSGHEDVGGWEETVVRYGIRSFRWKVTLIQGIREKEKHGLQWQSPHTVRMEKNFQCTSYRTFNVLYQTAEDGIADTIKPRLAKCGADMTRVRFINEDENSFLWRTIGLKKPSDRIVYDSWSWIPYRLIWGSQCGYEPGKWDFVLISTSQYDCRENWMCHCSLDIWISHQEVRAITVPWDHWYRSGSTKHLICRKGGKEKEQDIRVVYQQRILLLRRKIR